MGIVKIILEEYDKISENLNYKITNNSIKFFKDSINIGYVDYEFDGGTFSEYLPDGINSGEFYISMIKVFSEYRGMGFSSEMLKIVKKFAKRIGAKVITLRVDTGLGFGNKRNPDSGLERLYLKNGFKYLFDEDEITNDTTGVKNLGAMYYII